MRLSAAIIVAGMVGIAQAQTPQGFRPAVTNNLEVMFNTTKVTKPGELLTKAATASQPQLALPRANVSSSDTYVFVMLDLDVPGQGGNATRRTLLHAMTTGFKTTSQSVGGNAVLLASTEKGPASYFGPSPPATDTKAHRYTQLLFKQPSTLAVAASAFADTSARINFDIAAFAKTNGLGQPLAANFFTVDGRSAGNSGSASGTGRAPRATASNSPSGRNSTSPEFDGGASAVGLSMGALGTVAGFVFMMINL